MRATFFYDIRFLEKDGKVYSHYGVSNSMFNRYLDIFTQFTYVARLENVNNNNSRFINDKYLVSNINFVFFKNNYTDVYKVIRVEVSRAEFCIIRLPSIAGVIAKYECERQKRPYIVEVVGNILEALWFHSIKGKFLALPFHFIMKKTIRTSKFSSYITENYLQSKYPCDGKVYSGIPNVSLNSIRSDLLEFRVKRWKNRSGSPIKIGMIGSLDVDYKGHDTALLMLSVLKKMSYVVELHFLGPGSTQRWTKYARDVGVGSSVFFDGFLPGGNPVYEWLDEMDIYIQPSLTEGHGRAVVEAMSRGCVVFASKTGGLVDSVMEHSLFSKKDYMHLAQLVMNVIDNEAHYLCLLNTSMQTAQKYSQKNVERRRRQCFNEVIRHWRNEGLLKNASLQENE